MNRIRPKRITMAALAAKVNYFATNPTAAPRSYSGSVPAAEFYSRALRVQLRRRWIRGERLDLSKPSNSLALFGHASL